MSARPLSSFARVEAVASRISPFRSALLIALLSLATSALLSLCIAWPAPKIMDEFSYLLAGDTFSHGRLSNPTHPLWPYFESPQTIQQPTYCSKYPPGQGLLLALGEKLWRPLLGVWIEACTAAIAVYYLLRARSSQGWSFAGGILAIFHPLQLLWSQNYWGGGLQATGGALLVGAALRAYRQPNWKNGAVLGLGVSLLALSRPFEGAVFSLLCGIVLGFALFRKGHSSALRAIGSLAAGCLPLLLATAIFFAAYNKASTGNPFLFPYAIHERTYGGCPVFLWQHPATFPTYRYEAWRQEASWERASFEIQTTARGFWRYLLWVKFLPTAYPWTWYWLLLLPLAAACVSVPKRPELLAAASLLVCFVVSECQIIWWFPHYFAAAFGLMFLLAIEGLQKIRMTSTSRGPTICRAFVLLLIAVALAFQILGQFADKQGYHWEIEREALVRKLQQIPGDHLVMVSYSPDHSVHSEWVYNGADIDDSRVVFAHALANNAPLFRYFKNRKIWLLHVKADSYTLSALSPSSGLSR